MAGRGQKLGQVDFPVDVALRVRFMRFGDFEAGEGRCCRERRRLPDGGLSASEIVPIPHRADRSVFGTCAGAGEVGTTVSGAGLKLSRAPWTPAQSASVASRSRAIRGLGCAWLQGLNLIACVRTPSSREMIILAPCARPIATICRSTLIFLVRLFGAACNYRGSSQLRVPSWPAPGLPRDRSRPRRPWTFARAPRGTQRWRRRPFTRIR